MPQREFLFHKKRKWRFDLAWPDLLIAVEVEGGIWTGGRHVRGEGYEGDCEKYNEAQLAGWMVLRFTPGMIKKGKVGKRAGAAGDGLLLSRTQPRPTNAPALSLAEIQNPMIDAYLAALPDGREPRMAKAALGGVFRDRGPAVRAIQRASIHRRRGRWGSEYRGRLPSDASGHSGQLSAISP